LTDGEGDGKECGWVAMEMGDEVVEGCERVKIEGGYGCRVSRR
jgi:hypothetical protein